MKSFTHIFEEVWEDFNNTIAIKGFFCMIALSAIFVALSAMFYCRFEKILVYLGINFFVIFRS